MSEEVAKDLELVKRVIQTNGWSRGMLQSPYNGHVCLVGAINLAIAGDAHLDTAKSVRMVMTSHVRYHAVVNALGRAIESPRVYQSYSTGTLMGFNDRNNYGAVMAVIDRAIERERPKVRPTQLLQVGTPAPESGLLVMVQAPRQPKPTVQPKPKPVIQAPGRPRISPRREQVIEPMPEREKELVHV